MNNSGLLAVLLSWAAHLSGYAYPDTVPALEHRGHEFFVQHACGGMEKCPVVAWYNDKGVIYLDDRVTDMQDPIVRSLIVHEMVHYLQDLSGRYTAGGCTEQVERERQAYSVQRTYLNRVAGRFAAVYPTYADCSTATGDPGSTHEQ